MCDYYSRSGGCGRGLFPDGLRHGGWDDSVWHVMEKKEMHVMEKGASYHKSEKDGAVRNRKVSAKLY